MKPESVLRFGACDVLIFADRVETHFRDGTVVHAVPVDGPEHRSRAASLGYTGPDALWQMCREHDATHAWLAENVTGGASPALWHVVHPHSPPNHDLIALEEAAILALQAYIRALGRSVTNLGLMR